LLKSALGARDRGGDVWAAPDVTSAIHTANPTTAALLSRTALAADNLLKDRGKIAILILHPVSVLPAFRRPVSVILQPLNPAPQRPALRELLRPVSDRREPLSRANPEPSLDLCRMVLAGSAVPADTWRRRDHSRPLA
jgi:hypothetical protein